MRLFTALDISDEVKDSLRAFVARLRPLAALQWSPVENLHITTKFIGEWPEERLDDMKRALASVPMPVPLAISVRGFGWFPSERSPRVFWAGIEGGEALFALAREIEQAVAALGVPLEPRVYAPHLTLARIRETLPLDSLHKALDSLPATRCDFGSFHASRFFLYQSAAGQYTRLASFPLD